MKKSRMLFAALLTAITVCLDAGCSSSVPYGLVNKPHFDSMSWERMEIHYQVKLSDNRAEARSVVVDAPELLRSGLAKLRCAKTRDYGLPCSGRNKLVATGGEEWEMEVVFEDRFDFALSRNREFAYVVKTADYSFYDWLMTLCLHDAQRDFPSATGSNIMLRTNLDIKCYKAVGL